MLYKVAPRQYLIYNLERWQAPDDVMVGTPWDRDVQLGENLRRVRKIWF